MKALNSQTFPLSAFPGLSHRISGGREVEGQGCGWKRSGVLVHDMMLSVITVIHNIDQYLFLCICGNVNNSF